MQRVDARLIGIPGILVTLFEEQVCVRFIITLLPVYGETDNISATKLGRNWNFHVPPNMNATNASTVCRTEHTLCDIYNKTTF